MKILQVGKFYSPQVGGIETVIEAMCQSLAPHASVEALVANHEARTVRERIAGVGVTRVASFGRVAATSICPTFPSWIRKLSGQVNHLHESNPLATVSYLRARPAGKLIVSFHSEIVRQRFMLPVYRPLRQELLRRASRILVATPDHLRFSPSLQPFLTKCRVVPFGIDVGRFRQSEDLRERAAEFSARIGSPIVLFVGRLVYYKGVDVLIRAMKGVKATLVIVGEGPMSARWRRLAGNGNSRDHVRFLGEVPQADLPALYHASEMLVLPSTEPSEAFGLVQLEAMASGRPVISTSLDSGVAWVNEHGRTGLLVPPADSGALREAIQRLLSNSEERKSMGLEGIKRVRAEFDRASMGQRLMGVYQQALAAK